MNASEDCLVCGAKKPSGHVVVHDEQDYWAGTYSLDGVGRVCSSHTLFEVQTHVSDKLSVVVLKER